MQAANEGVRLAGDKGRSVGIRVDLPFEQTVNPFVELAFEHRTFFTRLHHFVLASDAFVVAPGGIGTVLETTMIWQLLQVRHLEHTPLILVGKLWPGLIEWVRSSMLSFETPLINAEDVDIPVCIANADEAIAIIGQYREQWTARKAPRARPAATQAVL
jgi:predicted Rossmann-fold nucleotide-binding protein